MREIRYRTIADDLRRQVSAGELGAGAVLPSEAALAGSYGVSRVTVRKALDLLREEGLVGSRQGFGWFVAGDRLRQSLDALATIEDQLAGQGRTPERRVVSFRFLPASGQVAGLLGTHVGDPPEVLEVVRVNLADGQPFAVVTVWCPGDLGAALSRDAVESATFYELLPVRFDRATQTIGAAVADATDAERLEVPVGSPLLVCERVSRDVAGAPVLVAEHRFPAHLTEFVVQLPFRPGGEHQAAGLRLVEGTQA